MSWKGFMVLLVTVIMAATTMASPLPKPSVSYGLGGHGGFGGGARAFGSGGFGGVSSHGLGYGFHHGRGFLGGGRSRIVRIQPALGGFAGFAQPSFGGYGGYGYGK
ncbi:uncharacterized protein [Panulirus ornatus]|uniref:uncharacterized protein isoform X1 n=1 Tax=Panulirus ornatus TaxID=150431 RepID=UPI003A8B8DF5